MTGGTLVLGPLLRYVDDTTAAVWVECSATATVTVVLGDRRVEAGTFAVQGHHYALVEIDGLTPGTETAYSVEISGSVVWPEADSAYPPPVIRTLDHARPLRMLFGSCRTSVAHDEKGNRSHGVDAMRAYGLRLAGVTGTRPREEWPDLALFLGDQVYADETSEAMQDFIASRRDIEQPPGEELKDYEEYAHLYKLAWNDPANRWLLSTLPSAMIFDDHDIRDDWNTSASWREKMARTEWWHGRLVAGLMSYWVYQHLGNLSPAERREDEIWRRVIEHDGPGEPDLSVPLEDLAERADENPESYRWSFARDLCGSRLVVIDSRAARVLTPERRSIIDDLEMAWLDDQMQGGFEHLLIGTSVPFMLSPGLHYVEAWNEALASLSDGKRRSRFGEWVRQLIDLEHWAAFQEGFRKVADMAIEVARGSRGSAPHTVTFLSGDVHHSYVTEAWPADGSEAHGRIVQAVCSPIRNPMPRGIRATTALLCSGLSGRAGARLARRMGVPPSPLEWKISHGPWYDNNIATLVADPDGLRMWWETGDIIDGDHGRPVLRRVAEVELDARPVPPA